MRDVLAASAVLLLASGDPAAAREAFAIRDPAAAREAFASGRAALSGEEVRCRTFEGPPGGVLIRYNCQAASDDSRDSRPPSPAAARKAKPAPAQRR